MKYIILLIILFSGCINDKGAMEFCSDACRKEGALYAEFYVPPSMHFIKTGGKKYLKCICVPQKGRTFHMHFGWDW
jgi:hypothetical protein